jgi:UDP-N-acetylmuramate dehydrogenase
MRHEQNTSLAPFTYYRIGGPARDIWFPETTDELAGLVGKLTGNGTPYFTLGGGTNVLIGDGFWDGAVIITTSLNGIEPDADMLTCGAGLDASSAAEIARDHGKTGLEFLYLLPGSIGGAVAGNARFDEISVSDVLVRVTAVHPEYGVRSFEAGDIDFQYKHTGIVKDGWTIADVTLRWQPGDTDQIARRMEAIERFRDDKQHFSDPSCGCIYKNDYEQNIRVGHLLDSLGLKGERIGDAAVAEFHANFIVNTGHATARDVLDLMERIEQRVRKETGLELEREVRLYGTFI